jgi:hypothetical protein
MNPDCFAYALKVLHGEAGHSKGATPEKDPTADTVAVSPAYYAEVERDAALSDVAARDERIRVLEGLLTQWLDYPGASFAALRRLAEDTRKALVARAGQCDHCGTDLVAVRPGKEQCEECEEVAK